ncbi:MAG: hypothetical protein Rhims3KO_08440 [Hyphomicrobiales bacterium]
MAVAPSPSVVTKGPNTAQAGPRVAPVTGAAPIAQGGGQAGAQAAQGTQPTAQQAAAAVKQVTTQALLTLMQSLGKPLSGTTTGTTSPLPNASGPTLNVQVQMPNAGGQTANGALGQTIAANLPLPKGSPVPLPGTPVLLTAEATASGPRLAVSVQGAAPPSPENLRMDAVRQGSLAPLMADIAKLSGQPGANKAVDAAIGKLMGFAIDSDVAGSTLRNAVDGARSLPQMAGQPTSTGPQAGVQSALGALIRALGIAIPDAQAKTLAHTNQGKAQPQLPQTADQKPVVPNLPSDTRQPTKAVAQTVPADAPDLADPTQLQALRTKAEAALSRLNLLQSRMQENSTQPARGEGPPAVRWDVPLMIGQEAALLGVAIERDGNAPGSGQDRHLHWRFRFAFQSALHGEVEGMVALHQSVEDEGSQVDVAVWVQKPGVLAMLEATRPDLVAKLEALGINTISLTIAPIENAPNPEVRATDTSRHLVDVRS